LDLLLPATAKSKLFGKPLIADLLERVYTMFASSLMRSNML